jgi:kinesin family protein 1
MADSIKIAVRVRPFNNKEKNENSTNIVEMEGQEVRLRNPDDGTIKKFGFHRCYYSTDDAMGHEPVNNTFLFNDIGKEILNHIYMGYNSTVFAYGQTGSGKSYSIEGAADPSSDGFK